MPRSAGIKNGCVALRFYKNLDILSELTPCYMIPRPVIEGAEK